MQERVKHTDASVKRPGFFLRRRSAKNSLAVKMNGTIHGYLINNGVNEHGANEPV